MLEKRKKDQFSVQPAVDVDELLDKTPELSNEEYDLALVALLQDSLADTVWEEKFNRKQALKLIPGYTTIPMLCKAERCEFAQCCPILKEIEGRDDEVLLKEEMKGKPCRVDQIESALNFAGILKELEIKPEETVSINTVTGLVGHYILKRRILWKINLMGLTQDYVGGISREGDVYYNKVSNELLKSLDIVQKTIDAQVKQLSASREEKNKRGAGLADELIAHLKLNKKKERVIIDVESQDTP